METSHPKYNRITVDPDKCTGKPCIRGMRLPVASILAHLGGGMTIDEMLAEWPMLEHEDVLQALSYASTVLDERQVPFARAA